MTDISQLLDAYVYITFTIDLMNYKKNPMSKTFINGIKKSLGEFQGFIGDYVTLYENSSLVFEWREDELLVDVYYNWIGKFNLFFCSN